MSELLFDLQSFSDEGYGDTGSVGYTDSSAGYSESTTDSSYATNNEGSERPTFDSLIKGDYKEDYQQALEKTLNRRMKGHKQNKARLESLTPMMGMLAQKYKIDIADANKLSDAEWDAISQAVTNDDSYYQDEAYERGMDVDTLKNLKATERELALLKSQQQESLENQVNREKFMSLQSDAAALQQLYPSFDLDTEMENPVFERMVWQAGVPLQNAYEAIHMGEIMPHAMQYATQQTQQQMANSLRSNMSRAPEGGNMARSAGLTHSSPSMSKEYREDIKARMRRGERVVL